MDLAESRRCRSDDACPAPDECRRGRRASLRVIQVASRNVPFGTLLYAIGVLVVAAGLLVMAIGPWRVGMSMCGGAFAAAAIARSGVPGRSGGGRKSVV